MASRPDIVKPQASSELHSLPRRVTMPQPHTPPIAVASPADWQTLVDRKLTTVLDPTAFRPVTRTRTVEPEKDAGNRSDCPVAPRRLRHAEPLSLACH